MYNDTLSVPRSQYRSQPTDRAIGLQPIAEADRKYRSQRLDKDVMQPYPTDRSFPIALIAPIADRSRDQLTDCSSQSPIATDRKESIRLKSCILQYLSLGTITNPWESAHLVPITLYFTYQIHHLGWFAEEDPHE